MTFRKSILFGLALLLGLMALFETTSLDLVVQDWFYDFDQGRWLIDSGAAVPKFIFYKFPKYVLIFFGLLLLLRTTLPRVAVQYVRLNRKKAFFLLLCLGIVPALISVGKKTTGVYCPSDVARYGGNHVYRHVLDSIRIAFHSPHSGCCFPAGHASGGFALMGLYYTAEDDRKRLAGLLTGLAGGWIMGFYQMFKGAHYLSHTLITMVTAWLMITLLARIFGLFPSAEDARIYS